MWKLNGKSHCGFRWFAAGIWSICLLAICASPIWAQKKPPEVDDSTNNPPPRPLYGSLSIVSNPPEADVYLSGKWIGKTDSKGKLSKSQLSPRRYTVVVKYPEYEDFIQEVLIRPDQLETVNATLTATFGILLLTVRDIKLVSKVELDGKVLSQDEYISDLEKSSLRIKTTPGEHNVSVAQSGYVTVNRTITVTAGESITVPIIAEREQGTLLVKSEPGARIYANDEFKGEVQNTGQLKIAALPGEYSIRLELDGYETAKREKVLVEAGKETPLEVALTPLPASAQFADPFLSLTQWEAPKEWGAENQLLHVRGASGVGFPKNKRYRNCGVLFGLRLVDARGAAWIVHAKDQKNYYLFYLNGPTGRFPNQLAVYICRNGVFDLNKPADPPQPISFPVLKKDEDYTIRIQVEGNEIQHWITPTKGSKAGTEISIGFFKDSNNSFPIGNVGFATLEGEEFLVNAFTVTPTK